MPPLQGIRVVELSRTIAGALAGMVLADNGAEVVTAEGPEAAERLREAPSVVWRRGKRSVATDIESDRGRFRLRAMARWADVLIEDLGFGKAERLGLGYQSIAAEAPNLVYVSITGYGEHGPLRDLPVDEALTAAVSGRMATLGEKGVPVFTPTPVAGYGAAMLAVQGSLAALRARGVLGRGQRVHTSLLHSLVAYDMTSGYGNRASMRTEAEGVFGVIPVCFMTAQCADEQYIQMCSRSPHLLRNWLRILGLESVLDDPEYARIPESFVSQQSMDSLIDRIRTAMRTKPRDEWLEIFAQEDVGGDPHFTAQEFLRSEQAQATDRVRHIVDPRVGPTRQIGPLATFSETPSVIDRPGPVYAGDTEAVLREARSVRNESCDGGGASKLTSPLEGVTVVEAAQAYASPFAMTLLAEMGARVIKIEPPAGDLARRNWLTDYTKETVGKESIVLDLKTADGQQVAHRLVQRADIFLHNFRPGVPERLRVDYQTLISLNPRLVYVYGSCYGSNGPFVRRPGFHSSPNAIAGTGAWEAGEGNTPQNRTFGDPAGALATATATLLALHARDRTGYGQYVETTMLASLAYTVSALGAQYENKPPDPQLDRDQRGLSPGRSLYPTADGWLLVSCRNESDWRKLLGELDAAELASDARFADEASRLSARVELREALGALFKKRSAADWQQRLIRVGVPAARADGIDHAEFMLHHPQMRANNLSVPDTLPGGEQFWRSEGSAEFSAMWTRRGTFDGLGASTTKVLSEFGYHDDEIERFYADGVTRPAAHQR